MFKPLGWYDRGIDDIVFVTMNYRCVSFTCRLFCAAFPSSVFGLDRGVSGGRLGIFGFLGSEELQAESRDGSTGNYGQQDQREAFKWVQRHISQFSGNPDKIMIWGQSSGAASVSMHLVSPRSWGIFSAAGMDSGGTYMPWSFKPKRHAQKVFNTVALWLNCTGEPFPPAALHSACRLNFTLDPTFDYYYNCTGTSTLPFHSQALKSF